MWQHSFSYSLLHLACIYRPLLAVGSSSWAQTTLEQGPVVLFPESDMKIPPCFLLGLQRAGVLSSWGGRLLPHVRFTPPGMAF